MVVLMVGYTNLMFSQVQQVPEVPSDGCYTTQQFVVYKTADFPNGNPLNDDWLVGCLDESYTFAAVVFDYNDNNKAWRWKIEKATIGTGGNPTIWTTVTTSNYFLPPYNPSSTLNWTNTVPISSGTAHYKVTLEQYDYTNNQLIVPATIIYPRTFDLYGNNPYTISVSYNSCFEVVLNSNLVGLLSVPCHRPTWAGADQVVAVNWGDGISGNAHVSNQSGPKFPIPAHQYTTPGYYTIELTNNVATCNFNQSQQLQVWIGNPNVVLSSTNSMICQSSTTAQTISTTVQSATPVTYAWSPSTGGAITTTTSSITVNPTVTTTYNVTVTDGNGCSTTASTTITVVNCCIGGNHNGTPLTFYNVTASQLISIFGANTITTTATIAINNLLDVNANITFTNCPNLVFGPNAQINLTAPSCSLTIDNSTLRSCSATQMWRGIRATQQNQNVFLRNNTKILDAAFGIQSSDDSRVDVTNTLFENCYIGIQMTNSTGGGRFVCRGSSFRTGVTLPKTPPTNVFNGAITQMFTGIEFIVCDNIQLTGIAVVGNSANIFSNLDCGLFVDRSSLNVCINNTFTFITNTLNQARSGFAIFAPANINNNLLCIGNNTPSNKNTFRNNTNDILTSGSTNVRVQLNDFVNTGITSILIVGVTGNAGGIDISNNLMQGIAGISNTAVSWWTNTSNTLIRNNIIRNYENAINVAGNLNSSLVTIDQNDITGVRYGIRLSQMVNSTIFNNFVKHFNTPYAGLLKEGISLANCNGVTINQNFIDGNSGSTTPLANTRGIVLNSSPNSVVECDSVVRCEWAIQGIGGCLPTRLRGNAMRDCTAGVVLNGQNAAFGLQWAFATPNTYDNKWYGTSGSIFSLGHTRAINGANGSNTGFVFRTAYTPAASAPFFFPSPFRNFTDGNMGSTQTNVSSGTFTSPLFTCALQTQYNTNKTVMPPLGSVPIMERIAQGDMEYSPDFDAALKQWDSESLFDLLKNDEDLRAASSVLDSFYTANASNSNMATTNEAIDLAAAADDSASADIALSKVDEIIPQTLSDINTKLIQTIYLQTYARGEMSLDSVQLSTVRSIAEQCFVFGGPAVFLARSMHNAAIGYVDNSFQDYCLDNFGSYKQPKPIKSNSEKYFLIVPNPIQKSNVWIAESNTALDFSVYNAIGQQVYETKLEVGINQIPTTGLSSGVYFYNSIAADGSKFYGKLVIE